MHLLTHAFTNTFSNRNITRVPALRSRPYTLDASPTRPYSEKKESGFVNFSQCL